MDLKNLILEKENKIAIVTINRPPVNNLNSETINEIREVLENLRQDKETRVLIITGKNREDKPEKSVFCAGADVTEFSLIFGTDKAEAFIKNGQDTFNMIEKFPKPVIACINGAALGGGCELAIACHFKVIADTAFLGLPEVRLGILPGYGGTSRLPRIIGRAKALEILLTGERVLPKDALSMGLVNRVVLKGEELKISLKLAQDLINHSAPLAIEKIINIVNSGNDLPLKDVLKLEREGILSLGTTEDATEGVSAMLQKRSANFKGK